jgi:hypothetical protein
VEFFLHLSIQATRSHNTVYVSSQQFTFFCVETIPMALINIWDKNNLKMIINISGIILHIVLCIGLKNIPVDSCFTRNKWNLL